MQVLLVVQSLSAYTHSTVEGTYGSGQIPECEGKPLTRQQVHEVSQRPPEEREAEEEWQ